jgi:hypothetical protein
MTDREMVLALGKYINGLLVEIETLKGVMDCIAQNPAPPRETSLEEMKRRVLEDEAFQRTVAAHRNALLHALGRETEASALIRAFHNHFVGE